MRPYVALVLFSICILAGACGNSLPPVSALTVTITPPMATLAVGTTVILTGNASGFTQRPGFDWEVVESGVGCSFLVGFTQNANFTNCPYGYVVSPLKTFPSPATYFAPPTAGVYHVQFTATQFSGIHSVSKSATAVVTVT
jgi:hypothetical protein